MRRGSSIFLFAGATLFLAHGIACSTEDNDQFRSDVLYCENAVARVEECCSRIAVPKKACVHFYSRTTSDCGCSESSGSSTTTRRTDPVLTISASRAIIDSTCDSLVANDGCTKLAADLAKENSSTYSTGCGGAGSTPYGGGYDPNGRRY